MLPYFDQVHSIGSVNVCANFVIHRYKMNNFNKHTKIYVLFDVT